MRDQSIQVLIAGGLSASLAESCVDVAGNIDQGKVEAIKDGIAWGRSPASTANPVLVANLIKELKIAHQNRDVQTMMRIRGGLEKLGVLNPQI